MSRSEQPNIGDILLLEDVASNCHFLCRVFKSTPGRWEAKHLFAIGPVHEYSTNTWWWGPDPQSWKSVTNLGPCIPAAPEVRDEVSI